MKTNNREVTLLKILILVITTFCYQIVFAEGLESTEHLRDITRIFVLSNIHAEPDETVTVNVSPSISQFQLAACSRDIEPAFPANINKEQATGVELSCNGEKSWHVLVPVEVQINTQVIVAKRTISPKDAVTEEDIDYASYDKNRLFNSYFKKSEEVIGQVAAHLITPGTVLTKKNLQQPVLVHRNQVVSLVARTKSISVTMQGVAKSDGSIDTVIKAYNPISKKTLDALVIGPNKAEIIA